MNTDCLCRVCCRRGQPALLIFGRDSKEASLWIKGRASALLLLTEWLIWEAYLAVSGWPGGRWGQKIGMWSSLTKYWLFWVTAAEVVVWLPRLPAAEVGGQSSVT